MVTTRRTWTPDEINIIRERYPRENIQELAEELNASPVQLSGIAHYYGVKQNQNPGRPWSITKVESEPSQLNVLDLMQSQYEIGQLLLAEKDFETAQRLQAIYRSMSEAINKSL